MDPRAKPRAYRISEVCALTGLGRTTIYHAIKNRELLARKCGRSTLVLASDLDNFLNELPVTGCAERVDP
jgi:excisionase family DNA binding protein